MSKIQILFTGTNKEPHAFVRRRVVFYPDLIACLVLEYYKQNDHDMAPLINMATADIKEIIDDYLKEHLFAVIEGNPAVTNKLYPMIHDQIKEYYKLYQR